MCANEAPSAPMHGLLEKDEEGEEKRRRTRTKREEKRRQETRQGDKTRQGERGVGAPQH